MKKNNKFTIDANQLKLSEKEYNTLSDLEKESFDEDYFVAGSDQIWNPIPADFDWAYYLPFVHDKKKIAYAPSLGQLSTTGTIEQEEKIKRLVNKFDALSVRENASLKKLHKLVGEEINISLNDFINLVKEDIKSKGKK